MPDVGSVKIIINRLKFIVSREKKGKVMRKLILTSLCLVLATSMVNGQIVEHDPWLNWDFLNRTGETAFDFTMIFEAGDFEPSEQVGDPFPNFAVTHADYDGDTDTDTKVKWSGGNGVIDGGDMIFGDDVGGLGEPDFAHIGLNMIGFEKLLDAYWTNLAGDKIGNSIAAPEEITQIIPGGSAEVKMKLQFPKAFYDDGGTGAGLLNIQTWRDMPAALVDLEDINIDLDLSTLTDYVVTPTPDEIDLGVYHTDDYFYVSLGITDDQYIGPEYESLLFAEIQNAGQIIGRFWNINPQSPEPATLVLLGLGAAAVLLRKRKA